MDELIDYVTESPENTNPNVVRSLVDKLPADGGSGPLVLFIQLIDTDFGPMPTLSETAETIINAFDSNRLVLIKYEEEDPEGYFTKQMVIINECAYTMGEVEPYYVFRCAEFGDFYAEKLTDYPVDNASE